ncbi:MAG: 6-phosphogluconolactonase [Planctomycetota bacterium]|nr:MAG: 6-phosphogluconolactonase [Planctomycetota bacterium]
MSAAGSLDLKVYRDADQLAAKAAVAVARAAAESIRHRGRFTLVLSGGSTPRKTYALLAEGDGETNVDWSRAYLFFGDERHVPHDDERSNYGMARESLLSVAPIPSEQVLPIPTGLPTAEACAEAYSTALAKFFALPSGTMPIFDLVLLGLGDDGHTASLFPGAEALGVDDRIATWSPPGTLPPPVDRITLTYPAINAAREVLFLVAGENKAEAVQDVLEGGADKQRRPAAGVRPEAGRLMWMLDEAAAGRLKNSG